MKIILRLCAVCHCVLGQVLTILPGDIVEVSHGTCQRPECLAKWGVKA